MAVNSLAMFAQRVDLCLRDVRQCWNPTRRWVDHDGRLVGCADCLAWVKPELIVVTNDIGWFLVITGCQFGKSIRFKGSGFFMGEKILLS